ncbi:MAG: OmpA family protein [Hyphomicrobiaceae bacterium]
MSQPSVSRLKELLFEQEAREIDALAARVAAQAEAERRQMAELASRVEAVAAVNTRERGELARRIEDLAKRTGGDAELRASVARIIDGSLKDAETSRHRELADAMAPVVVRTVRAEIVAPQTQDQIAGALYPKIGQMVSRYVASAMRDLMEGINRRLESGLTNNRLMLKLRSMSSGRSMAELALADTQRLDVEEIYLILRGSGELIHHWQRPGSEPDGVPSGANRDTLVSGFLTAITAFAEEAFVADKASLRSLDLDEHKIYLRGSPSHLVAAKCRGSAPGEIEALLDAELIKVLDEHSALESPRANGEPVRDRAALAPARDQLLAALAKRIETGAAARVDAGRQAGGGLRPLKVLLWLIGLPLLALALWLTWNTVQSRLIQAAAQSAVAAVPELKGYPIQIRVRRGGQVVKVDGLTPSVEARDVLRNRLNGIALGITVIDRLGVVPQSDVDKAVQRQAVRAGLVRTEQRLNRLGNELRQAAARLGGDEAASTFGQVEADVARAATQIADLATRGTTDGIEAVVASVMAQLEAQQTRLATLVGPAGNEPLPAAGTSGVDANTRSAVTELDRVDLIAERLSQLATIVEQTRMAAADQAKAVAPLRRQIEDLARRLDGMRTVQTPRQLLEDYIRQNAIFFANGVEYRNQKAAIDSLDELARLIKTASVFVRVIGYTDEAGTVARNVQLSQQRADQVLDELVRRGVPRQRLVAVGRATALELAPRTGPGLASRRVEFEIGFIGEETDPQ